jgi:hypothetical protein
LISASPYQPKERRPKIIKLDIKDSILQPISLKFRRPLRKTYIPKLENLGEMNKFLDTHEVPKLNQEDINNVNRVC